MKHLKLALFLITIVGILTSCSKEENVDPLAEYYGTYHVSESASDNTWTANFTVGENPGEVFITNALGTSDEDTHVIARIEGSTFTISRQAIHETSFVEGQGSIGDQKIDCRITLDVDGIFQVYYNIYYEKM